MATDQELFIENLLNLRAQGGGVAYTSNSAWIVQPDKATKEADAQAAITEEVERVTIQSDLGPLPVSEAVVQQHGGSPEAFIQTLQTYAVQREAQQYIALGMEAAADSTKPDVMITEEEAAKLEKKRQEYEGAYSKTEEKLASMGPIERHITNSLMLASPRGSEFVAAGIFGNIDKSLNALGLETSFFKPSKTPHQIQTEFITEGFVLDKMPFITTKKADFFGLSYTAPSGFLPRMATESPIGAFGLGVAGGYATSAILGELSLAYPTFGHALTRASQAVGNKAYFALAAAQGTSMVMDYQQGRPIEQIGGNIITMGSGIAGAHLGFQLGIFEGLPFKYKKTNTEFKPPEEMTSEKILSGEQKLPYSHESPDELVQQFKGGEFRFYKDYRVSMYHAGARSGDIEFIGGYRSLAVKGGGGKWASSVLYGSPELSPYFLGAGDSSSWSSILASGKGLRPGGRAFVIQLADVQRIPPEYRGSMDSMNFYLDNMASRNVGYVTPEFELGKPESEIGIPEGGFLSQQYGQGAYGFRYYSTVKGPLGIDMKYPIYEYVALPTPAPNTLSTGQLTQISGGGFQNVIIFGKYGSSIMSSQASAGAAASILMLSSSRGESGQKSVASSISRSTLSISSVARPSSSRPSGYSFMPSYPAKSSTLRSSLLASSVLGASSISYPGSRSGSPSYKPYYSKPSKPFTGISMPSIFLTDETKLFKPGSFKPFTRKKRYTASVVGSEFDLKISKAPKISLGGGIRGIIKPRRRRRK